eukprot:2768088-Prymnesium_polylepis.1
MVEYACPERATYIANLTLDDYKPIAAVSRQRLCKSNLKASHKRVVEWAMKHAESDLSKGVTFTYRFAADKEFGRMTSNSMMGIPRDIRGFVCIGNNNGEPVLTDLDMETCHPVILQWLCHKHGFSCAALTEYIANRAQHTEDLMEATGESKDCVKSMFLAALNSEDVREHWQAQLTPFFKSFDKECKEIQKAFMQLTEYRWVLPHAQKSAHEKLEERKAERRRDRKTVSGLSANVAGSFINLILCTWENRFLGVACKTITAMGYEVSVNNFDGMMIRGNHYPEGNVSKVRDEVLCPALERALFAEFGIKMGWSMKRHSTNIVFDARSDLKLPYSVVAEPVLEKICRVGSEYFLELADGNRVVESRRGLNERLEGCTAQCMFNDKKSWHKRNSFADTLCRDPALRTYERAEMYPDPSECPQTVYNLWKPMPCEAWDVTEADPTSDHVAAFRKHVLILAGRDEKVAAFIELWIAHMLHFPWKKPNAWLVFMSEEGAGKGTLVEMIKLLVGSGKVKEISNVQRSLLGTFNQAMLDGFLLVLDEAAGKHLFEGKEELKNLITAPTIPVNQKHEKEKDVRSYARFMMTIQPRAVPTKKGDRRGVI